MIPKCTQISSDANFNLTNASPTTVTRAQVELLFISQLLHDVWPFAGPEVKKTETTHTDTHTTCLRTPVR